MFDDENRKKLYESFKTEEGVQKWFSKNRKKFEKDIDDNKKTYEIIEKGAFPNEETKQLALLSTLSIQKTLEMINDILALSEITFRYNIELNNGLRDLILIVQEKGSNMNEKLAELANKIKKHEPSLTWIDKFFEHQSTSQN